MTLPTADTTVTYPDGDTVSTGTVLHVEPFSDDRWAVILDVTAFHPVDTAWPDQPTDRGSITTSAGTQIIEDAVTGGILDGGLFLGPELPVRMGTEGWIFVVAHIVSGEPPAVGEEATIAVDEEYRAELSAGHTACHLASLALDAALAEAWTKPAPTDSLGNPAFDALAIQQSRIVPNGSTDLYRIGKSLRRKGFTATALDDTVAVERAANERLAEWVENAGEVTITREGSALSDRRAWVCELMGGATSIPCGGTHIRSLSELASVQVALERTDVTGGFEIVMQTVAARS
ncbi:metal-dependent hydrolase [Humidisolicoccus flavus]|uniref:metal-dependent hydrolase n=1 Tax=Humidisolicoccus flavus TaxID=3111414 RepID=UPI0032554128